MRIDSVQRHQAIAGKLCDVWTNTRQRVKLWRWKGLDLRYENNALENRRSRFEAKSVEVGVKVPVAVFTPPKDYTAVDRTK